MNNEEPPIIEFPPANIWMRIAAYGMDMLLILAILWAIGNTIPAAATAFLEQMEVEKIQRIILLMTYSTISKNITKHHNDPLPFPLYSGK